MKSIIWKRILSIWFQYKFLIPRAQDQQQQYSLWQTREVCRNIIIFSSFFPIFFLLCASLFLIRLFYFSFFFFVVPLMVYYFVLFICFCYVCTESQSDADANANQYILSEMDCSSISDLGCINKCFLYGISINHHLSLGNNIFHSPVCLCLMNWLLCRAEREVQSGSFFFILFFNS